VNRSNKFLLCLCLTAAMGAEAAIPVQIDDARAKGLAWLVKNQKGDGSWQAHGALKVQSTASALEALMQAGMRSGETYGAAVGWLSNVEASSIDAKSRKAAALALAGLDTTSLVQALLAARPQTDRQVWGAYPQYTMSFPDTPLGLAALRLSGYSYANQDTELLSAVACSVLPAQRSDGGWSHVNPAASAPDSVKGSSLLPTALTLLELAAQKAAKGWTTLSCNSVNYDLATVLNNGVIFLVSRKNADNGFGEKSVSTVLDTALAYVAIQAANPSHSALGPAQDYLLTGAGKPGTDGGWGGDPLATAFVLKTLPVVVLPDGDGDGVPDAVETALNNGSSTTVADGRSAAPGNGQGTSGVNSSLLLPVATTGAAYLHGLALSGQSGFALASGSLPPGLSLDANGQITGTPAQSGTFNFQYRYNATQTRLAQLAVSDPSDGDVPTLPEWGAILLSAGLMFSMYRHRRQ